MQSFVYGLRISLGGRSVGRKSEANETIIEQVAGFEIKVAGFWLLIELGGISYGS